MMADVRAGMTVQDVRVVQADTYVRFHSGVDKVVAALRARRHWMPHVYYLHGAAGVNKSRIAHNVCKGSVYFKPPDTLWFDGYNGEDVVVINDLRKSTFTFSYLLDLLDRYDFQVEVKGGYAPMLAKVFMITCSKPHHELWAELHGTVNDNLKQLTRRIHEEFAVTATNLHEQKCLLSRIRDSLVHMRDPANCDVEDLFDEWDGKGPIPPPPRERSRSPRRVQALEASDDAVALVAPRMCNHPVLDTDYVRRIKYTYSTYPDGPGPGYVDHNV